MAHTVHYFKAGGMLYRIGYPPTWAVFKSLWFYRSFDTQRLPREGGAILASNHASHFDPVLVGLTSFRPVKFLARESLFYNPLFGRLISGLGAFPIMRAKAPEGGTIDAHDAAADSGPATDMRALRTAIDLLKEGHRLVMFPEGTRSPDGRLRKFQPGVAMMFLRSKAPLVPLYIHGNHRVFPRGAKSPNVFRPIKVFVGEPIHFADLPSGMRSKKQHEWILTELHARIAAMQVAAWQRFPLPGPRFDDPALQAAATAATAEAAEAVETAASSPGPAIDSSTPLVASEPETPATPRPPAAPSTPAEPAELAEPTAPAAPAEPTAPAAVATVAPRESHPAP
ncbi:MAG: lysophospholipid acyltransferase family protein [Planctomycetota bacterium]